MLEDVLHQRINRRIIPEHRLHLPEITLTLLDYLRIRLLCHTVILRIDQCQGLGIQFQLHHTALIVDRSRRAILHRLCHIVDVDIVAEHLARTAILCRDRRPRKADIRHIRQTVPNDTRRADHAFCDFLPFLIVRKTNPLRQTILPTVRLIRHHDNITPFRQ